MTTKRIPVGDRTPRRPRKAASSRPLNLALQGGGSHGAFTWGVVDRLLDDGRIGIDAISGTSAGSMNAVVIAHGYIHGNDGARQALYDFWRAISDMGVRANPMASFGPLFAVSGSNPWQWAMDQWSQVLARTFTPYQRNPLHLNPLRDLLQQQVDFEKMNRESKVQLFLAATNVRSGKVKVFGIDEAITADMVMASACLPDLFPAVEINGEHYWDGGFMGNPVLYPLFYHPRSRDVLIVHVDPITRDKVPDTADEIQDRVNEITFNSSLIKELRAVQFVQKLLQDGWIKDAYRSKLRDMLMHSIRADQVLADLSASSKMRTDWDFLSMLRDRGRSTASAWLEDNFKYIGRKSSVDLVEQFL